MAQLTDLSRYKWRKRGKVVETKVKVELLDKYDTCSTDELLAKVAEANLFEAVLEMDEKPVYYDEPTVALYVTGWREATDEELAAAYAEVDEAKRRAQAYKDKQIAALKKSDPDLFKEI